MATVKNDKEEYLVPAIERAFAVLEFVISSEEGCSFNNIINTLKLPKSTAFTVINTLVHCGYLEKNGNKLFVPTIKTYSIGIGARNSVVKSHIFASSLEDLRNATGFTVYLVIYDRGEKVCIEKIDGYGSILFRANVGERSNLNTAAAGKAIAAYLTDDDLNLVLSKGLVKKTENSICDENKFIEHLSLVREQGYALDDGEEDVSQRCLGMPVFMSGNAIFGSVSISTTKENLPFEKIPSYLGILGMTAENISLKLGFTESYHQRLRQR